MTADGHLPEKIAYQVAPDVRHLGRRADRESDLPLLGAEPAAGGGPGLDDFVWRLRRTGRASDEELHALALAKANELSMRVRAEGELDGTVYGHVLRVGETVPLDGLGDRLNGLYYVDRVTHRFTPDGYTQAFRLLRNAYGDITAPAARSAPRRVARPDLTGLMGRMTWKSCCPQVTRELQKKYYGKYRGFVVDDEDPDKRGRLRCGPSVLGSEETAWALPCVPFGGGAGYGLFAVPPVDSQVWVEFEEGELSQPIWTGTFWQNKGDPPPGGHGGREAHVRTC